MSLNWNQANIPDQSSKVIVITGANSGIGLEAARELAGKGAHIVLAVRNELKGKTAVSAIVKAFPQASIEVMPLDLADLSSVHRFSESFGKRYHNLSTLINNAGVMAPPYRTTTDQFEMQFGTNHLGHFALTGLLLPQLLATSDARVVNVSSMAHTFGTIDFDNLDGTKGYRRWRFYGQSKLANLLFTYELQRKLETTKSNLISVACHPGFAATNLTAAGIGMNLAWVGKGMGQLANIAAQSASMGALPTLYAATEPNVKGGDYIGPLGRSGMRGYPSKVQSNARSHDADVARRLWETSERLTQVQFNFS